MIAMEWFAAFREGRISSCYLFHGEEEGLKARALRDLRATLPEGLEALNETAFASNASVLDIIAACETMPMMADRRLVIVTDPAALTARGKDDDAVRLAAYLPTMPETTTLVFYQHGEADMRRKLATALSKLGAVVSFGALDDAQLVRWAQRAAKREGAAIPPPVVEALSLRRGRLTQSLEPEIAKLSAYALSQGRAEIAREDVEALVAYTLEFAVYKLVDEMLEGHAQTAMTMFSRLVREGENRIGILALITRSVRICFHVKCMTERRMSPPDIEKALGANRYAVRAAQRQGQRRSVAFLRGALDACVQADGDIKSGRVRDEIAVERLICSLSQGQLPVVGIEGNARHA